MMLNGKLIIDELLIILFVFTLSLFPVEARTTSGNGQKVLVISSYSPIKEEGNHLIASFIDQMQVDSEAKIFVETGSKYTAMINDRDTGTDLFDLFHVVGSVDNS